MRFCQACGQGNLDDARFCESCGTGLAPVGGAESAAPAAPVAAPAAAVPPAAYAPIPAAAPAASSVWRDLRARYGNTPRYVLIGVVVLVVAFIVYSSFFKPMTSTEYRTKALAYAGVLKNASGSIFSSSTLQGVGSADANDRADAKKAWETFAKSARISIAGIRGLRPPGEYQTTQGRLVQGVTAYEKVVDAMDAFVSKVSTGEYGDLNDSSNDKYKTLAEYKALEAVFGDNAISKATSAFDKAYTKLQQSAPGGDQ
jgi:hypothetical protein